MKKATVILSMVLILILSFGTVTAFASGVEFEEIPYTYDTQDIYGDEDIEAMLEGTFGEYASGLVGIIVVSSICMLLFVPALAVMIVFIVLNNKTKKKLREYQKMQMYAPVAPVNVCGIFSQTNTMQNPQPVNTNAAPMGVNPCSIPNAEPQNNINEQGGQF